MEISELITKIREIRDRLYSEGEFHFAECLDRAVAIIAECVVDSPEAAIAILDCLERIEAYFHSIYDKTSDTIISATNTEICKLILGKYPEYGMPVKK